MYRLTNQITVLLFLSFFLTISPGPPDDQSTPLTPGTENLQLTRLSSISGSTTPEQGNPGEEHTITITPQQPQQENISLFEQKVMKGIAISSCFLTGVVFTVGSLLVTGVIGEKDDGSINTASTMGCWGTSIVLTAVGTLSCMHYCNLRRTRRTF